VPIVSGGRHAPVLTFLGQMHSPQTALYANVSYWSTWHGSERAAKIAKISKTAKT